MRQHDSGIWPWASEIVVSATLKVTQCGGVDIQSQDMSTSHAPFDCYSGGKYVYFYDVCKGNCSLRMRLGGMEITRPV